MFYIFRIPIVLHDDDDHIFIIHLLYTYICACACVCINSKHTYSYTTRCTCTICFCVHPARLVPLRIKHRAARRSRRRPSSSDFTIIRAHGLHYPAVLHRRIGMFFNDYFRILIGPVLHCSANISIRIAVFTLTVESHGKI